MIFSVRKGALPTMSPNARLSDLALAPCRAVASADPNAIPCRSRYPETNAIDRRLGAIVRLAKRQAAFGVLRALADRPPRPSAPPLTRRRHRCTARGCRRSDPLFNIRWAERS